MRNILLLLLMACASTAYIHVMKSRVYPQNLKHCSSIKATHSLFRGHWKRFKHHKQQKISMEGKGPIAANVGFHSAESNPKNGAWLPIGSAQSLVGNVPVSVEIVGEKLVVWRSGDTWSVMRDVCPHRLAPLSQGRVDSVSGCLECPYHGWHFSSEGACTKIPQLPSKPLSNVERAAERTSATAFPVRLTGDLIWAFLPLPAGQV